MRSDIEAALLGGSNWMVRRPLRRLEALLGSDERPLLVTTGYYRGGPCLVAVSDRQVILIDRTLFPAKPTMLPLGQISATALRGGPLSTSLEITTASRTERVKGMNRQTAQTLANAIDQAIADR